MINYIKELKSQTEIYSNNGVEYYSGYKGYLNVLANKNLMDIPNYKKLVKKNLDIKYNIPLYINRNTLLIKFNEFYINYYQLHSVSHNDNYITFIFKNGNRLRIIGNYKNFVKYYSIGFKINDYINKISNE